jgi:hypothetical protein
VSAVPNSEQRALRIVHCAGCESLQLQVEEMAVDMDGLQRELKRKRREVTRLEGDIVRLIRGKDSPTHAKAEKIGEFWKKTTGHTRSKFDIPREKAVIHALDLAAAMYPEECENDEDFAARVVCCAIVGCVRLGHQDPRTGVKYDELKMICRDAEMFEKNLRRYFAYMAQIGRPAVIPPLDDPGEGSE